MRLLASLWMAFAAAPALAQEPTVFRVDGWVGGVAFSADSTTLAAACANGAVHLFHVTAPKFPAPFLPASNSPCSSVAISSSNYRAWGSFNHKVYVQRADDRPMPFAGHRGVVTSVAFSPDGKILATGSVDTTVILWDPVKGKALDALKGHKSWVNAVAFNRAGVLATASSDNSVRTWEKDGKGWDEKARFEFPEGEVRSLAWSPDGKALVAGVRYGIVALIEVASKKVRRKKAHAADVWAVAFAPDGKRFASGDGDWDRPGSVLLWEATSFEQAGRLKTSGEVLSLAYSPDGRMLAAGCWDKTVHLWKMANHAPGK